MTSAVDPGEHRWGCGRRLLFGGFRCGDRAHNGDLKLCLDCRRNERELAAQETCRAEEQAGRDHADWDAAQRARGADADPDPAARAAFDVAPFGHTTDRPGGEARGGGVCAWQGTGAEVLLADEPSCPDCEEPVEELRPALAAEVCPCGYPTSRKIHTGGEHCPAPAAPAHRHDVTCIGDYGAPVCGIDEDVDGGEG